MDCLCTGFGADKIVSTGSVEMSFDEDRSATPREGATTMRRDPSAVQQSGSMMQQNEPVMKQPSMQRQTSMQQREPSNQMRRDPSGVSPKQQQDRATPEMQQHDTKIQAEANPFSAHAPADDDEASVSDDSSEIGKMSHKKVPPQADEHGMPGKVTNAVKRNEFMDDESESSEKKKPTKGAHSFLGSGLESLKYLYSVALLLFSVACVTAAIFTKQTTATCKKNIHPAIAFVIFWFLLAWLSMMEGGQGALVGLQPVDKAMCAESHPRTLRNTLLVHKGDNMERFVVGRQFLVVLVVFVTNLTASAVKDANVFNLNSVVSEIFLGSGVAVILCTIMIGQLTAQINAANCMLDFLNNYFMLFTIYISLAVDMSGLLHSVYLVQIILSKITGKPIESNEPPRNALQKLFFWARVMMSLAILGFAFAVTLPALFQGKTTMWAGVPSAVSVVVFFVLMCFVGMMEGTQIALFAAANLPDEQLKIHAIAYANCQLTFAGQNLQAFLIGRQICVTCSMFVVARITTVNIDTSAGDRAILGLGNGFQAFINTGFLGAFITTIVASLAWRIIASSFPVAFLSNPLIYVIIRLCLILEASGLCSAAWVTARWNKLIAGFQPDEVYLEGAERHTSEPVTRRDKDIDRLVTVLKFTYSMILLVFAIVLVMTAIFTRKTTATGQKNIHPAIAFIIFWFLISWLAMMEGGQGALVDLQPIDKDKYAETHPRTLMNTRLAHKGDNMERFIVGRQFLVVLIVFVTNLMASTVADATVLGFSKIISDIFLSTGLALMLCTIMIGQLTAQVNAANCMLDFLNNYYMLFTTYVSLGIEMSGLLHSAYLVQIIFSKISGQPIDSKEPPRNAIQNVLFWGRVLMSLVILGFAFMVTLSALFSGKTMMWSGVPSAVSVIVFFIIMCFVGIMEGVQIALFAVVNLPEKELKNHAIAYANYQLIFTGHNLQPFLIGRQICVTCGIFVVARIITVNVDVGAGDSTIFGLGGGFQNFFNTGLLGALLGAVITTIVGSLAWRVIASSFPVAFMSNPLIYMIIRLCLLLEASGVCSAAWVTGRWNKLLVGFQPDEVYLAGVPKHGFAPVTRRDKDIDVFVTVLKYGYSTALLIFSVTIVMSAIFTRQTKISDKVHPLLAFFVMWGLIILLGMMEGGQGCLVGLQPVDKELYRESHPVTYKNTTVTHRGDNMERFIVGRQFLVVLIVFVTNQYGALKDSSVLNLPSGFTQVFLSSGVAMILCTIILGQLTAQVNAANCMLDFINTSFMTFTTYVSLGIEASGLLHSIYLVQIAFSKIAGKLIESKEPPRTGIKKILFWVKVAMSLAILGYAFAATLTALFSAKTPIWNGVPSAVRVVVFFVLMCFVGMMEGIQIAMFAVVNLPEEELKNHSIAYANYQLTFSGSNFQAFLIGRQMCVTVCMFMVAKITTLNFDVDSGATNTIFGVRKGVQKFFNTGILGAVITTLVASLAWRIIASSFPVAFLSNPMISVIIRLCLILEASGVCSAAWLLALIHKAIAGFQLDEVYIGKPEDRVAAKKGDLEMEEDA